MVGGRRANRSADCSKEPDRREVINDDDIISKPHSKTKTTTKHIKAFLSSDRMQIAIRNVDG